MPYMICQPQAQRSTQIDKKVYVVRGSPKKEDHWADPPKGQWGPFDQAQPS